MLALALLLLSVDSASHLHQRGLEAASQGRFQDAVAFYAEAVAAWRELGPDYRTHQATTLVNLGQARQSIGDWPRAIDAYRDAAALSPAPAILSRLGGALAAVGRTEEAEPLLLRALSVQTEDSPETAGTLNNLAVLYAQLGKWEKAEPLVERAVAIFNRTEGKESTGSAMLLTNLGSIHLQQGRPERAAPLFRRARRIYESTLGKDCPQLAMVLSQEGLMLLHENKLQLATREFSEAVRILRKVTGEQSLDTSVAETNLALAHLSSGRTEEACSLLTHALAVQEQLYSPAARELQITRTSLQRCRAARKGLRAAQADKNEPTPTTQPQAARGLLGR